MQFDYNDMNLSATDLAQLSLWLEGSETPANAMSLLEVEGYLFALICAPEPVEDEVWLKQVLGGDVSDLADDKLFALMALFNGLSSQIFETGYHLPEAVKLAQPIESNFTQGSALHLWSRGFSQGISYVAPLLESEQVDIELRSAFAMAINCLTFFVDQQNAEQQAEQHQCEFNDLSVQMFDMLPDFTTGYAELVEAVAVSSGLFNDEGWE